MVRLHAPPPPGGTRTALKAPYGPPRVNGYCFMPGVNISNITLTYPDMAADPAPEDFLKPSEMATLETGPMAPLVEAVKLGHRVLIALRSNRKLYGELKAVDRHWNMILENCFELWSSSNSSGHSQVHTRRIKRLFLRGDNVICVYPNPTRVPDAFTE
jgi:small nuclear ribonucleoprotein D2